MGSAFCGSPPDKLFRCNSNEESVGLKSEFGMGPLNLFILKSTYTNSKTESKALSGPHIVFSETDK